MSKWLMANIPLSGGLNLAMDPQAAEPGDFVQLDNVQFDAGIGIGPRPGNVKLPVRDSSLTYDVPPSYTEWLYGYGPYDPNSPQQGITYSSTGPIRGIASRDGELMAWDGWRSLSYNQGQWNPHGEGDTRTNGIPVSEPSMVAHATERTVVGLVDTAQRVDVAQGVFRTCYAWRESTEVFVTVEDNDTKAAPYRRVRVYNADPEYIRVVYSRREDQTSGYFFVIISDNAATAIRVVVLAELDLDNSFINSSSYVEISAAATAPKPYDVRPVSGGKCGVLWEQGGNLRYVTVTGAKTTDVAANLDITGTGIIANSPVALAVHPDSTIMATWTWNNAGTKQVEAAFYLGNGSARLYTPVFMNSALPLTTEFRVACEFCYLLNTSGAYRGAVSWTDSSNNITYVRQLAGNATNGTASRVGDSVLTHQAMRVGDVPFFTVGYVKSNTIQPMFVTLAADKMGVTSKPRLYPMAAQLRGSATVSVADKVCQSTSYQPSATDGYPNCVNSSKWTYVALGSRVVLTTSGITRKDYQTTKVDLDFLPAFRAAQGGRSLYVAGGVVQEFDGASFRPAGFLQIPEVSVAGSATAGSMTNGVYLFRIYAEERNALGEWIRSAAITKSVTLAGQTSVDITYPAMPYVYRDKWRWSVYRTSVNGSLLKLVTQITPAYTTVRYTAVTTNNGASDASIANGALDPCPATTQSGIGLMDQMAPPSCTIIAAGNQRVWFAGGAVPNGQVAYSRLFDPGEVALWYEALVVQVDRTDKPVTGLGFMQDALVVFKEDRAALVTGQGPDNLGRDDFNPPQAILSDLGCISPDSVGTTPLGVAFQSKFGPRIVSPGGGLVNIGMKVDMAFDPAEPRVVSVGDSTVRFHGRRDTYAMDYANPSNPRWSKWTYGAVGVTKWRDTNAFIPSPYLTDCVWYESEAEASDGGVGFGVAMDLGWLKTGEPAAGWGRVKWFGLVGRYLSPHYVQGNIKYDYRDIPVDQWTWKPAVVDQVEPTDVAPMDITQDEGFLGGTSSYPGETAMDANGGLHYPGGPYVYCKSFNRQRTGTFRMYIEFNHVINVDDEAKNIKSLRSGGSITALTVAFQPATENERARWGRRMGAH